MRCTFVARFVCAALLAGLIASSAPASAAPAPRPAAGTDSATFAGGCFWCMETQFEGLPGVKSVTSGYTGGWKKQPTYEEVCAHTTGHLEAVRIVFDPAVVSYGKLLERFWHGVDPTQADGQFCDIGESYRSAIFFHGEPQRRQALASKVALERAKVLRGPVVTRIVAAGDFWPAEEYHQDYWKKNPARYRSYREGCGRDRRLAELWGKAAALPLVH